MLSKDALLASRLSNKEVEIPGVGSVRVRGLSRAEAMQLGQMANDGDMVGSEIFLLSTALVDPVLTEDEVKEWREAAPTGELNPVMEAVLELSGLNEAAVNEAAKSFRNGSAEAA